MIQGGGIVKFGGALLADVGRKFFVLGVGDPFQEFNLSLIFK